MSGNTFFVQTVNPTATLSTPLANQCRRCIDDQQSSYPNNIIDDTTHCDREFKSVIIFASYLGHFLIINVIQSQHVDQDVTRDKDVALLDQQVLCAVTSTCKVAV